MLIIKSIGVFLLTLLSLVVLNIVCNVVFCGVWYIVNSVPEPFGSLCFIMIILGLPLATIITIAYISVKKEKG